MKKEKEKQSELRKYKRPESNYFITPNKVVNDNRLSGDAYKIFSYLLSKPDRWNFYKTDILKHMKPGPHGNFPEAKYLRSIKELEKFGYIERKKLPTGNFQYILLDPDVPDEKPCTEKQHMAKTKPCTEKQHMGATPRKTLLGKNRAYSNTDKENKTNKEKEENKKDICPRSKEKENLNKLARPIAKKIADIVTSYKNIKITSSRKGKWLDPIKKLHTLDGVSFERMHKALDWYADHAEDKYVPVIQCGGKFREKFVKLEDAIKRDRSSSYNGNGNGIAGRPKIPGSDYWTAVKEGRIKDN